MAQDTAAPVVELGSTPAAAEVTPQASQPELPKFEPGFATQQDLELVAEYIAAHPEKYPDAESAKVAFNEAGITDLNAAKAAYKKFKRAYALKRQKEREEQAQLEAANAPELSFPSQDSIQSAEPSTPAVSEETPANTVAETDQPIEASEPANSNSSTPTQPITSPAAKSASETTAEKDETTATVSSDGSATFSNGMAIGFVTKDGRELPRISWMPEFTVGNFGIALDLEFFIVDGSPSSEGWEFDTKDEILNTLYRKIYYIRYNKPGDKFYIRAGAIKDITMDVAGLITNGWGNVAKYPGQKLLGVHTQFNNWFEPIGLNIEAATNSIEDWHKDGGVIAAKGSFKPVGFLGVPVISDFRVGATFAADMNQYAQMPDKDGDGCPDALDMLEDDANFCVRSQNSEKSNIIFPNSWGDGLKDQFVAANVTHDSLQSEELKKAFKANTFRLFAVDAFLPVINTEILKLDFYSEYAMPLYAESYIPKNSYGIVPLGTRLQLSILSIGLEYRHFNGAFNAGHFDHNYEIQRVTYNDVTNQYLTKEETYWTQDLGKRHGVYGDLGLDLGIFATVGAQYQHLWSDDADEPLDRSYRGELALGESIVSFIPKVSSASVYFAKKRIGQDKGPDGQWVEDGFFELSQYASWGYEMGFDMNGMTVIIGSNYTYQYEGDALVSKNQFKAETKISF